LTGLFRAKAHHGIDESSSAQAVLKSWEIAFRRTRIAVAEGVALY